MGGVEKQEIGSAEVHALLKNAKINDEKIQGSYFVDISIAYEERVILLGMQRSFLLLLDEYAECLLTDLLKNCEASLHRYVVFSTALELWKK